MRLSLPAFLFKLPNGNIFSGKRRVIKPVTKKAVELLRNDLATEEQNMFYLRHPFLTREQSSGHSQYLQKKEKWNIQFRDFRNKKFSKNRTLVSELTHLKASEQWEFGAGSL